jgi:glutathione S-transferase
MNIKGEFKNFKIWSKAQSDIDRISAIWRECLGAYGGPWLFGEFSIADAMYAPVATRFLTYDVKLDPVCAAYAKRILAHPFAVEWIEAAKLEKEEIEELEVEF